MIYLTKKGDGIKKDIFFYGFCNFVQKNPPSRLSKLSSCAQRRITGRFDCVRWGAMRRAFANHGERTTERGKNQKVKKYLFYISSSEKRTIIINNI